MWLKKFGIHSTIVEKETFPRYHIGESFTGETGGQLRKLGMEEVLNKDYPIKYGTKVYGAQGKNSFYVPVRDRLGPGGSQRPATTWQARRSDFDKMLWDTALSRGVEVFPGEAVSVLQEGDKVTGIRARSQSGVEEDLRAEVVIDASGQGTFLANKGVTSSKERGNYDRQVAIFSQIVGGIRDEGEKKDDTLIFYEKKHHWAWWIPLDKEAVSLGVVVPSWYFTEKKQSKIDFIKSEMMTLNPDLAWRVKDVNFVEDGRAASNYSYYVRRFTGNGYLCVGDSHRFIDPIFSLGLLFATKEAEFSAMAVKDFLEGKNRDSENPFAEYERYVDRGQDIIQAMLDCFWEFPLPFQRFVHMTHTEDMVDLFAGRLYGDAVHQQDGVIRMKRLLEMKGIGRSIEETEGMAASHAGSAGAND
jgi:flavin-dependent dehydrogenase